MTKTKLIGSAGRFGVRYGQSARRRTAAIESIQRKKQICHLCGGVAKRLSKGIWQCKKCLKKFAGHAYYLGSQQNKVEELEAKVLKNENLAKSEQNAENKAKKLKKNNKQ